jgi:hypothetical protein
MSIASETRKAYTGVIDRAQAYQIAASLTKPTDCRKIQTELVSLHKFRMARDCEEMTIRINRLNEMLDQKIGALPAQNQEEFLRIMADKYENLAMPELTDKIDMILKTTGNLSELVQSRQFMLIPATPGVPSGVTESPKEERWHPIKVDNGEPVKRRSRGRRNSPDGKAAKVWELFKNAYSPGQRVTGREVVAMMDAGLDEKKSITDSLRLLYNKKYLKRKLVANKYYYWRVR